MGLPQEARPEPEEEDLGEEPPQAVPKLRSALSRVLPFGVFLYGLGRGLPCVYTYDGQSAKVMECPIVKNTYKAKKYTRETPRNPKYKRCKTHLVGQFECCHCMLTSEPHVLQLRSLAFVSVLKFEAAGPLSCTHVVLINFEIICLRIVCFEGGGPWALSLLCSFATGGPRPVYFIAFVLLSETGSARPVYLFAFACFEIGGLDSLLFVFGQFVFQVVFGPVGEHLWALGKRGGPPVRCVPSRQILHCSLHEVALTEEEEKQFFPPKVTPDLAPHVLSKAADKNESVE